MVGGRQRLLPLLGVLAACKGSVVAYHRRIDARIARDLARALGDSHVAAQWDQLFTAQAAVLADRDRALAVAVLEE